MTLKRTSFRVGIDGYNLALPKGTGVATYARTLSYCLQDMGCEIDVLYGVNVHKKMSPALREVIFFDSLGQEHARKRPKFPSVRWTKETYRHFAGHEAVQIPMTGRVEARSFASRMPAYDRIWSVLDLFRSASGFFKTTGKFLAVEMPNAPEIMHWTYPLPIYVKGSKNIYTIHDIVPLTLPYTTLDNKGLYYRLIKKIVQNADAICTVSEASKREILSFFGGVEDKIFNTYQSFSSREVFDNVKKFSQKGIVTTESLFGLSPDGYYMFFGSLEPKKNIGRIIEGFLGASTSRKLVIVGAMAWKSENELRFLEQGIKSGRVVHLEYLPNEMLLSLVRHARAVLFPSLSEGFGLPVLEALSLGTPALISREGALPEVGGDACLLVDAYNAASITDGIEQLDKNENLYLDLCARSSQQAEKFSMARYAQRLLAMYQSVM
ncbi:glycosyltransferase family 4 protein [Gluconobacter morbifer]|uniref:Group 1 glycosyl transferase n=1 Tax=Gluconobacter morbifer G707 TaxID=1088869 RepID=G6XLU5_9PROT|nr:glycosyltransferase family 1 protein [Gluconobacter morbifer]EHH67350.1 group 1 glycosyl transferase [Gluconobacter morbifer G707]